MHWVLLAALALAAAFFLWYAQTVNIRKPSFRDPPPDGEEDAFRRWLYGPGVQEALEQAVELLIQLMAHPALGGPGFLTVRLPQPGEDGAVQVTAQYPNIREAMYRRVIRQELDRETLLTSGMPEELAGLSPRFETDSGGVVMVSLQAAVIEPGLVSLLSGRGERQEALRMLAECLGQRFPALEVRPFGAELLLTPVREGAVV